MIAFGVDIFVFQAEKPHSVVSYSPVDQQMRPFGAILIKYT